MTTPMNVLAGLLADAALPARLLSQMEFTGPDLVLPSSFQVERAASASIAATGLAAALLHEARGGVAQSVRVDTLHACAAFHSEHFTRIDGHWLPRELGDIAGLYRTAGGGWVRLHTNFAHHRAMMLEFLGCAPTKAAVAATLAPRDAFEIEAEAIARNLTISACRSFAQWDAHPHRAAVDTRPLIAIEKIGEAPPAAWKPGATPLEGLRVLDLTRVIAGPVGTRTLAAHGAEVMTINPPHLAAFAAPELGRGKRQAIVDLRIAEGLDRLWALLAATDIFVQGYRPGTLAARGFSAEAVAARRPGIVCASLNAYGNAGPWSSRRGFDSLVQTATGFNRAEAEAFGQETPRPMPVQALDHGTGYLLALGILAALYRRQTEGGSWHVTVSLVRTGHWLRGLGRRSESLDLPGQHHDDVIDLLEPSESGFGRMEAIRHPALLSATPARFTRPSVPPGAHPPVW